MDVKAQPEAVHRGVDYVPMRMLAMLVSLESPVSDQWIQQA